MNKSGFLRVAVLVDLPRTPQSGGHVKCWERLASAAAQAELPLDLTVYFSGRGPDENIGLHTRFRYLPPVFSTAALKFLPYVPDHTDLAPYHPRLARELGHYDVIHTTDGFFAFARTAAHISRTHGIPLVSSIHTDTPSYTRIFTRETITKILGPTGFGRWLGRIMIEDWRLPERQGQSMERKLRRHLRSCRHALATREEDHIFAIDLLGKNSVSHMRRGIDQEMFGPHRRDRGGIECDYRIPPDRIIVLFVGRVDVGKNIYTLVSAIEKLLAEKYPLHLVVAGVGPALEDVKARLGDHVSAPGFIAPPELARLYASADVLAVSSEVETHSMVANEAIASGCPVLIAQKSGVAEIFNDISAMHIVNGGVAAWTTALRDFASQPDMRAAMRNAAIQYNREHLSGWQDVLVEDFLTVWQKVARQAVQKRRAG